MNDETLVRKLGLLSTVQERTLDDDDPLMPQDGYRPFVVTRQAMQTAVMLNLQYRSGDSQSFAYSHLYRIEYTNGTTLTLTFSDHQVVISGRRFGELHRRLQLQRVLQICEADRPTADLAKSDDTLIEGLSVRALTPVAA